MKGFETSLTGHLVQFVSSSKYSSAVGICIVVLATLWLSGCSAAKESSTDYSREVAVHSEEMGENSVMTKVIEERKNGIYTLRVQVVKDGKMTETVHNLDSDNFSISIPVSASIQVASGGGDSAAEQAVKTGDTNVVLFSQRLERARESMLAADYLEALESVNGALQIDTYNPQAHMMKGSIFYALGKYDLAKKEFEYVLKVEPENIEVKRFLEFVDNKKDVGKKVNIQGIEGQ